MEKETRNKYLVFLLKVLIFLLLLTFVKSLAFEHFITKQKSMDHTLHEGNVVLVAKFGKEKLTRGDVICLKNPRRKSEDEDLFTKRIIGVEKDIIRMENGRVTVNGEYVDEPYVSPENNQRNVFGEWEVPINSYFVLGDNRDVSLDSREFGFIPEYDVVGKVVFRVYPFSEIGTIK